MNTECSVLLEERVGDERCPLVVGIFVFQQVYILLRCCRVALARVEQEQMVEGICHVVVVGILCFQTTQRLLAERQVVEFVLEDHARVEQSVHDCLVAGFYLLFGERNLRKIILAFVRVVLCAVLDLFERVGKSLCPGNRVGLLLCELRLRVRAANGHHRLVYALPVVDVFTFSPPLLEVLLSLVHGHLVIEIPQPLALLRSVVLLRVVLAVGVVVACAAVLCYCLLRVLFSLFALLLFLLLFQSFNDAVYRLVARLLVGFGKPLQRVLQMHGIGVRHQLVEHL